MSRQCTPRSFCSFYAIWLEMSPPCANEPPKKLVKYFSTPYVLYIYIYIVVQLNRTLPTKCDLITPPVRRRMRSQSSLFVGRMRVPIHHRQASPATWGRVSATSLERWRSIYGCLCKTGVDQHGKTEIELQTTS